MIKAWNELVQHQIPWYTGKAEDPDSEWYLATGVKIEKFKDGTIEIKATQTTGDWYMDLTENQKMYFEDYGWFAGLYKVNVDYWIGKVDDRLYLYNKSIGQEDECDKSEKLGKAQEKLEDYRLKLREALKSVQ